VVDEQELPGDLQRVLADPATWAQPPDALQEQVVAAIAAERTSLRAPADGSLPRSRARGSRRRLVALAGAAAAVVVGIAAAAVQVGTHGSDQPVFTGRLSGTVLAPGASGEVRLTRSPGGWRIYLQADGLPRRAGRTYYEAWLKAPDGTLVPVGTFNEPHDVTLWSGVAPSGYPTFTVTRQVADGDPASTGEVVLSGRTALRR
jgi:hypothetical protein